MLELSSPNKAVKPKPNPLARLWFPALRSDRSLRPTLVSLHGLASDVESVFNRSRY